MKRDYNLATEGLIIVSQTVFFVVLFLLIKSFLLDNFGIMNDMETLRRNALQIAAIYFAIIVFICIGMCPLYHYEFALIVVIGVAISVMAIIYRDIIRVYKPSSSMSDAVFAKVVTPLNPSVTF